MHFLSLSTVRGALAAATCLSLATMAWAGGNPADTFQSVAMPVSAAGGFSLVVPNGGMNQQVASTFSPVESIPIHSTTSPFTINLVVGSGLAGNAPALAAWERAAAEWTTRLVDPVTVNINADLLNMGSATIIGSTSSVALQADYDTIRDSMVADAAIDGVRDAIVNALPTAGQYTARLPAGFTLSGDAYTTKANLKALGFSGLDAAFGASDAAITFNSGFSFDYDNRNGVTAGTIDFQSVVAHEMGHALGFDSAVDTVDYYKAIGVTAPVEPTALDLFRFGATTAKPTSTSNFTTFARSLLPGEEDITDDLTKEYRMATGAYTGDGSQASHWKDMSQTGVLEGIMNPTISYGAIREVGDADVRALDLIGWDVATPEPASVSLLALGAVGLVWRRGRRKC